MIGYRPKASLSDWELKHERVIRDFKIAVGCCVGWRKYLYARPCTSPPTLNAQRTEAIFTANTLPTAKHGVLHFFPDLLPLVLIKCRTGLDRRDLIPSKCQRHAAGISSQW